jgi:DNA-binding NarL/FixJ family response regulator
MSPTRVSICDDVRELRALIRYHVDAEADLEVVSESGNGAAALRDVARAQPDVLVLDLSMPEMDGLEVLVRIREVAPETRVVVLSGLALDRVRAEASRLGAVRFVDKTLPMSALVDAVREVASLPGA